MNIHGLSCSSSTDEVYLIISESGVLPSLSPPVLHGVFAAEAGERRDRRRLFSVLFRTEREQKVFEQQGVEEYLRYQIDHENEPFAPGPAFPFVKVRPDLCEVIIIVPVCWRTSDATL